MILGRDEESFLIRLSETERRDLEAGEVLSRLVAWSAGCFELTIKLIKREGPLEHVPD